MNGRLGRWLVAGEWRAHPWRAAAALAAIAIGVALGLAVHLINASAVAEFTQAVRAVTGQADLEVRGPREGFAEALYFRIAADPAVAVASPLLEVEARVLDDRAGAPRSLRVLGVDLFAAARVTPELLGVPADGEGDALLGDDTVFLSAAAQAALGLAPGGSLRLQVGLAELRLRVAGGLPATRPGQLLAVMDLGAAQWRLARLGRLSRIALRLADGADTAVVRERLAAQLPAGVFIVAPAAGELRAANLSRAYRVNLDVLALVALFTGAFLVYSTQALAVVRRRGQFALLRTLGWPQRALLRQIVAEGATLGLAGSLVGAGLGIAAARAALGLFGGDLGGGYFAGVAPPLVVAWPAVAGFLVLGTLAAAAGSLAPALAMARAVPAQALKDGGEAAAVGLPRRAWPGLLLLAAGLALLPVPPLAGLPLAGYLAIGCWLVGGILLVPGLAARSFGLVARGLAPAAARRPLVFLSVQRLARAPGQASLALAGVVASFALMVAMAIMVGSFRDSVDRWLGRVLAAPLYLRVPAGGGSAFIGPAEQAAIAAHADVGRAEWLRFQLIDLDPARPPVTVIARELDPADPGARIPLTGPALPVTGLAAGTLPIWVSEAMGDLYGWSLGRQVLLPLAGRAVPATVAGVWRDFGRQHGTVTLSLADYRRLTGDTGVSDGALWPRPGVAPPALAATLQRDLPAARSLEFAEPGLIRERSLRIFDRSFAVTYLLELVAIGIGLAGIGATFSAQALARAREFGLLRHLGVGRRQLLRLLALEAAGLTLFGVAAGGVLGVAIAQVLIRVVNPQSFHWSMELAVPWPLLATVTGLLLAAGVATALLATRQATGTGPLQAVRADW
jgi:putative ABC transport system permease protein